MYAGYQYDEESKYYNLHARYYDPQTARFLQQDTYRGTIADPLSLNLYTYCHNEPMMYYDPTGHALTKWDQAHLSKDEQKKILEYSLQWSHADKMSKIATFSTAISAYENAKKVAHDRAEEIRNKYRTEREYGSENGYTTYVTGNGTVYKDSLASYYYIKNYLSNSTSEGAGKTDRMSTLEEVKYEKGYNSFTYMANGANVNVNIYITDTSTEYVTFSLGKKGVEKLENMTIEGKKVVAKTNAGYFSGSVESLGIFALDGKWLSEGQNGYDYENYPTLMAKTVNGKQQVTATKYQGQVSKKDKIIALAAQNDWVIAETGGNRITSESRNPRTIIGYRKDGSFVIVAVDGPIVSGKRTGLTTKESAQLMEEFGVQYALNLDGGPSTQMYVGNELVSDTILEKNGLRSIGSALFVAKK